MPHGSGFKVIFSSRPGRLAIAVALLGLLAFVAVPWFCRGVGAWRSEVRVMEAHLHSPTRLEFYVGSCQGSPEVSLFREADTEIQVKVVAWITPLLGGAECLDSVHVQLQEPLGDRVVIDRHTGEQVEVSGDSIYRDAQPRADWRVVEVPGRPGEAGFSMRLPPGWELNVMRAVDGYVGEVSGDNMRLDLDYGDFSRISGPVNDSSHTHVETYRGIGGLPAELLISITSSAGYTGVYFPNLGGSRLSLVGQDLTLEQQRNAVAVFASIRVQTSPDT